nr:phage tail protein [Pseudomonas sp.]
MGAAREAVVGDHLELSGRKGGESKPKSPYEAPDNLQSTATAKILIAVGEGEFEGTPTAQNIFLDNTPLADAAGNLNFPGVRWEWRPGSVEQSHIPGIPNVENETTVNVELRSDTAFVRALSNTQLSAVRLRFAWPALQRQDSEGNLGGYRIEYAVDVATDGGAYVEALREAVDGKTTTRYERSRRIDLPKAETGWQLRVRRLTANQNNNRIADTMIIAGLSEVIDAKLRYPNTALLFIEFSAEQFTNIPAVTVKCKARKFQVPSNYDSETRTYSGVWDGTFKNAWTNNPAWITYGLCVNDRFGLGRRIKPWMVDKWELYRIAQYCDQLVDDGKGGQEPRFLCDLNLQAKAEAWVLLRDIAAIYRGMTYWSQGQLMSQADMPRETDFDYVFTRGNVVDGKFTYGSGSARTRYSRALVSFDNPDNNYDTDVVPVTDKRLQRRYGDRPVELSAIGCTRQSEAQRRGKWVLLTNTQDRTVNFKTGMEGRIPLPGYVIPVADSLLAGREIGGRIAAVAGRVITLDRDTQVKPGDRLILNLPSGKAEGRTVRLVAGRHVTVTTDYSEVPAPQLVWAIDADDLRIQLYRVMKVARDTDGNYTIDALQYEPTKFDAIDTGARLETRPISVVPISSIEAPASVAITAFHSLDQGIAINTMTIAWPSVSGAVAYDVEWRKDSGNWIRLPRTGALSVDVVGIYTGGYVARVRAVSAWEVSSIWRESMQTQLEGKTGAPPALASLATTPLIFGIGLKWLFPEGVEDTQRTEVEYANNATGQNALKLGDFAYPQSEHELHGLAAGVRFWFRARLVDRTGNVGAWTAWVEGISSTDVSAYDAYFAGKINRTALGQYLGEKIDLIDELEREIGELSDALAYDPTQTYVAGDTVRGGPGGRRLYQALDDVPAETPPPAADYWLDIGQVVQDANGLAQQVQKNTAGLSEIDGKVTAQATSLDSLRAAWRDDNADGDLEGALQAWDSTAKFAQEVKVRATQNESLVQRLTTLDSKVGENAASITELERTVATDLVAVAEQVQELQAEVGENSAAVQVVAKAQADIEGGLSTMWAVKLQVAQGGLYEWAGFGLGIEEQEGVVQSTFAIRANLFSILNATGGGAVAPFVVQNGQTIISSAVIGDATISWLKIGDDVQSSDYVAGQRGWRLSKGGSIEFNGVVSGGGRLTVTNQLIQVFDPNGTLRVRLGIFP